VSMVDVPSLFCDHNNKFMEEAQTPDNPTPESFTGCSYKGWKYRDYPQVLCASITAAAIVLSDAGPEGCVSMNAVFEELGRADQRDLLEAMVTSGQAELLFDVMGRPASLTILDTPPGASEDLVRATYSPEADQIALWTTEEPISPAEMAAALWHKMGHVWQSRHGEAIGELWDRHGVGPPDQSRSSYAAFSRLEHQAEASAAACGILQLLRRPEITDASIKTSIMNLEDTAPGSILLVRTLFSHPRLAGSRARARTISGIDFTPVELPGGWSERENSPQARRARVTIAGLGEGAAKAYRKREAKRLKRSR
jgi:hypothetical protein